MEENQAKYFSCAILISKSGDLSETNMRHFVLPALSFLLISCATTPHNEKSSGFLSDTPAGSTLKVNKPLAISANEIRASLQFGKKVKLHQVNKWEPYCELAVQTLSPQEKQIPAVDFRITRVVHDQEPYTRLKNSRRAMIASADDNFAYVYDDSKYTWLIKTSLYLESNDYPDIHRLVCGQVWDGYTSRHLYLSQFIEAVDSYLSIETRHRK